LSHQLLYFLGELGDLLILVGHLRTQLFVFINVFLF
jgi:hypothetical protein